MLKLQPPRPLRQSSLEVVQALLEVACLLGRRDRSGSWGRRVAQESLSLWMISWASAQAQVSSPSMWRWSVWTV